MSEDLARSRLKSGAAEGCSSQKGGFGWPSKVQQKCNSEKMVFAKVTYKPLRGRAQPKGLEPLTF